MAQRRCALFVNKDKMRLNAYKSPGREGTSRKLGFFYGPGGAMFRKVDPRIWTDEKFRKLSDKPKLLFLYILTHPHQTAVGAFCATLDGIAAELGWKKRNLVTALRQLEATQMVRYEQNTTIWDAPNYLKYNKPNKMGRPILHEIASRLPNGQVKSSILQRLTTEKNQVRMRLENETENKKEKEVSTEQQKVASAPLSVPKVFLNLKLYRDDKKLCRKWPELFPDYQVAFPGIDLIAELVKAHTWELSNPKRRKKDRPKFLNNWFSKAQDMASRGARGTPSGKASWEIEQEESDNAMRKQWEERNERLQKS